MHQSKWERRAGEWVTDSLSGSSRQKPSLLLVTVDCLRADHCGFYGYSRPTTPSLDALAVESFVVPAAIVAGAPTYYSFPAIFASRMPLAFGRDVIGVAPGETTLATVLHDAGYATAAFSAANPYLSPRFGYHQGFEVFDDFQNFDCKPSQVAVAAAHSEEKDFSFAKANRFTRDVASACGLKRAYDELYFRYCMRVAPPVTSMDALRKYPSADILIDRALSWLSTTLNRPFFLWLHLMDPHSPYYPTEEAFQKFTGKKIVPTDARYLNEYWNRSDLSAKNLRKKRSEVIELYDAGIRGMDEQIARLVDGLKQLNRWNDCVFALTGDHGEEFVEHGGRYHPPRSLHEEVIRVPLLIRVPGHSSGKVPCSPMSHLHLGPTFLEMLELPIPAAFRGRSLWADLQRGTAWNDLAIVECAYECTNPFQVENRRVPRLLCVRGTRFKLVMRMGRDSVEEVYDLESDPDELHEDAGDFQGGTRSQFLQAALEHLDTVVGSQDTLMRVRSQLRDLRYEVFN